MDREPFQEPLGLLTWKGCWTFLPIHRDSSWALRCAETRKFNPPRKVLEGGGIRFPAIIAACCLLPTLFGCPKTMIEFCMLRPHWWTPKPYDLKTASIASDGESLLYASEKSVCSLKGREKPYPRKTQNRDVGPYKDLDGFVRAACAPIKLCLAAVN